MTQYYTFKTQVNLKPGEKLGFTTGKGYYAIPVPPLKAAAPAQQQPPAAPPPASTPTTGPARTPTPATPTPATPTPATSAGIPSKPAVARQPATLAVTQPTAATTAPPPAAQPERRATEHPIQPSSVTRAHPVVANHPPSYKPITKAHATSEIAKLTTTHGTITNITIHPAAEQRDKHTTLELLATRASVATRSGSSGLISDAASGGGHGPGRSRISGNVERTRGITATAAAGSNYGSNAASGGGYSTRPNLIDTASSSKATLPIGETSTDSAPAGSGAGRPTHPQPMRSLMAHSQQSGIPTGLGWLDRKISQGEAKLASIAKTVVDVGLDAVAVVPYTEYYVSYQALRGIKGLAQKAGPAEPLVRAILMPVTIGLVVAEAHGLAGDIAIDLVKGESVRDERVGPPKEGYINPFHRWLPPWLRGPQTYLPGWGKKGLDWQGP